MGTNGKISKMDPRVRTKFRIRKRLSGSDARPRVSVFRSSKHIYAQLISDEQGVTIASASTHDPEVIETLKGFEAGDRPTSLKSVLAAKAVGLVLARRGKEKAIQSAVFDRNGFAYTGRIQAVADGAREGGLQF